MSGAREVAAGFYDAFNRGDLDGAEQFFSSDVESVNPTSTFTGWDAFRQFMEVFKAASPDARLEVRTWVDGGDVVAAEGSFTGTFTGPLATPQGELPPTGQPYDLPFAEINEVREGRIVSHRVYYDQMALLIAFGAMPPPEG